MNDVGFLYYRDKDTGEYKLLGKASGVIVEGVRNCGAMTLTGGPSKIIDTTEREMKKKELPFSVMRKICKHYSISRDMYSGGQLEDACHHPDVVPSGDSWGKCSMDTCPLYVERKTDE